MSSLYLAPPRQWVHGAQVLGFPISALGLLLDRGSAQKPPIVYEVTPLEPIKEACPGKSLLERGCLWHELQLPVASRLEV